MQRVASLETMESITNASKQPLLRVRNALCSCGTIPCFSQCSGSTAVNTEVNSLYPMFRHVIGRYCSGSPLHPAFGMRIFLPLTNHSGSFASPLSTILVISHKLWERSYTKRRGGHPFRAPSSSWLSAEPCSKFQDQVLPELPQELSSSLSSRF